MSPRAETDDRALLQELVVAGEMAAVADACLTLLDAGTEPTDRAALVRVGTAMLKERWKVGSELAKEQAGAAAIVVSSFASIAEWSDAGWWYLPDDGDLAYRLLVARSRDFRDAWVALAFDGMALNPTALARRLVAGGLATKPDTDAYTVALVGQPGAFDLSDEQVKWRGNAAVLDLLRANPDLLVDDIWRVFEVEGSGENSLAAFDKYCPAAQGWRAALVALADEGMLDRSRLLDASLSALQRGFAQFRAQWFSAFHEALAPTADERIERTSTYLALTASPIGPTVSMALTALEVIQKAGALDPSEVVDTIGPALLSPAKGSATKAIGILSKAVAGEPDLVPRAAAVLVDSLVHPAAEVQQVGVSRLRLWFGVPPSDLAESVERVRDSCHPTVRVELDAWLGDAPNRRTSTPAGPPAAAPERTRTHAAAAAIEDWTAPDRMLRPIEDLDELFEQASGMLEAPGLSDELEVLITSIAGEGRARVMEDARATTLARRARKLAERSERPSQRLIIGVLIAWLAPDQFAATMKMSSSVATSIALDDLLGARVVSLMQSLLSGECFTPLAAPTHQHGIIDSMVFAERVCSVREEPAPVELTSAMLRLAPDPAKLSEAHSALVRSPAPTSVRSSIEPWLAAWAEHCRSDVTRPGSWTCTKGSTYGNYTHYTLGIEGPAVLTPAGAPLRVTLPTPMWGRYQQDPAGVEWMGSLVPGLSGAWARIGASAIGPTYGTKDVSHGDPAYLERFFDPCARFGDDTHLLLALALNDPRAPVQSVAIDLAVAAIDDGRLDAVVLGDQIGRLASTGLVMPRRWDRSLALVAATHAGSRDVIIALLEQAIAVAEPRKPQDLLGLLELLEALLVDAGSAVESATAREALALLSGGSKTAKAAGRLLSLESR